MPQGDYTDTIFAVSTPRGRAALHLHRISGPDVFMRMLPFLRLPRDHSKIALTQHELLAFLTHSVPHARYLTVVDGNQHVVDDVMATFYRAPHSYTGEDTIEISTHGNPLITRTLHSLLRWIGLRDALPGEFTQRAYLNGKLDLTQAEAVNQIIHAETSNGLALAQNANEGQLSRSTRELRALLTDMLAYLEAHIDFGSEDVGSYEPESLLPTLETLAMRLKALAATYQNGIKVREGIRVALSGKPNAGKSSLYNALLGSDRAIVTDIPGTTRDVLEERLVLEGRDFVLLDTAGLRKSFDTVENLGIDRTRASMAKADIVCFVIEVPLSIGKGSSLFESIQSEIADLLQEMPLDSKARKLLILSKLDLLPLASQSQIKELLPKLALGFGEAVCVAQNDCSCLRATLIFSYDSQTDIGNLLENPVLISARQLDKVTKAQSAVVLAQNLIAVHDFPEKIASTLSQARLALVEIVGEITLDEVLDSVFSRFCIGK